jgi:hypothetical protein
MLNVVKTFENIIQNFDTIKNADTIEHFDLNSLLKYDESDLSSYDSKRDEYNKLYPDKKEKKNTFFEDLEKQKKTEKCGFDLLDTTCYTGLKIAIWALIMAGSFMTIVFIMFVISKLLSSASHTNQTIATPPASQGPQQPPQNSPSPKPSFLNKMLHPSASFEPPQQNQLQQPQQPPQAAEHHNFFDRLMGSKPAPIPSQAPPPKGNFMGRLLGSSE